MLVDYLKNFDKNTRCDPEVSRDGKTLCYCDSPSETMERWVYHIRWVSGHEKIDWGYSCGRAFVSYIGDYEKIFEAAKMLYPAFTRHGGTVLTWFGSDDEFLKE